MISLENENFSLEQIHESGQCFRWKKQEDGSWLIPAFGRKLTARQKSAHLLEFDCSGREWEEIWAPYFDLDRDYAAIGRTIEAQGDAYLLACFEAGYGIRILRQELWEVMISFMISQNNNIPRIRNSIERICDRCASDGHFPAPEEIDPDIFDDASLGLGYRAPYLRDMVIYARAHSGFPGELASMEGEDAMERLMEFKGIGKKVAGCISLFGLGIASAFPIDTHIRKVLDREYGGRFDTGPYEGFAGIIQQYMFYSQTHPLKTGLEQ